MVPNFKYRAIISLGFTLFLFFLKLHVSSQKNDKIAELRKKLNSKIHDTTRILCYGDIAFEFLNLNIDSAERYARKALEISKNSTYKKYYADALTVNGTIERFRGNAGKALEYYNLCYKIRKQLNDSTGMFKVLGNIGNVYSRNLTEYETSLKYYFKSLKIQKKLKDEKGLPVTYINISSVYMNQGKYYPALEYLQDAEMFAEKFDDKITLSKVYHNMGDLFNNVGQHEKSVKYLERSLELKKESGDSLGIANAMNNLSVVYEEMKQYDKALFYNKEALRLRIGINDSLEIVTSNANMAIILLAMDKKQEALEFALKAFDLSEKLNDAQYKALALSVLGEVYLALENPSKAAGYCEKSYQLLSNYNSKIQTRDACKCLYISYDRLNKTDKAFFYFKKFVELDDTLKAQNRSVDVVQQRAKYEFEKKQTADSLKRAAEEKNRELIRYEQEKAANEKIWWQQWVMIAVSAASLVVIVSIVLFFRSNRLKQKAVAMQKIAEAEIMALRAQMNPHFIFNCLSSIQNCIDKNEIEIADKYLGKFSKLLRLSLQTSRKAFINLTDEITYLTLYLELESLRFNNQFKFVFNIDPSIDQNETEIPVMILQPFIENSIKHGLAMKKEGGLLQVDIRKNDNRLLIEITDNGIGREKSTAMKKKDGSLKNHQSMGLQITKERLFLLYKNTGLDNPIEIIDLYGNNNESLGTKIILKLPIND